MRLIRGLKMGELTGCIFFFFFLKIDLRFYRARCSLRRCSDIWKSACDRYICFTTVIAKGTLCVGLGELIPFRQVEMVLTCANKLYPCMGIDFF